LSVSYDGTDFKPCLSNNAHSGEKALTRIDAFCIRRTAELYRLNEGKDYLINIGGASLEKLLRKA